MNFKDAQIYLMFENQINKKKYKEIAREIGISKSTVCDIIRGKHAKASKKTLAMIETWLERKQHSLIKRQSLWKRILTFLGVEK